MNKIWKTPDAEIDSAFKPVWENIYNLFKVVDKTPLVLSAYRVVEFLHKNYPNQPPDYIDWSPDGIIIEKSVQEFLVEIEVKKDSTERTNYKDGKVESMKQIDVIL